MNILVNRQSLVNSISTIESIVPTREIRPVASNLLLEAKDGHVIISATDFEINFRDKVEITVKEAGKICLPAKKISQMLKQMHCEDVSIAMDAADSKVVIKAGNADPETEKEKGKESKAIVTMVSGNIEEFPEMKFPKKSDFVSIDATLLLQMIKKIEYAMAEEDARYIFNGMFLNFTNGELVAVATDGRRLSVCKEKIELKIDFGSGIIIPHKSVREMRKILEMTHSARVYYNKEEQKLFVNSNNLDFSTRLIDGQYPNYEQVIPSKVEHTLKINKQEFEKRLRLSAVMAAEPSRQVLLTFHGNELLLDASTPDIGKAQDSMELTDYKGEEFKIALNSKYLFDVIHVMDSDDMILEISSESSPIVLRDEEFSGFRALIMPMKI